MTDSLLTLRSAVNTWECDGNGHLNIQFYFSHFDDAAQVMKAAVPTGLGAHLSRHVRFHAELHTEEDIVVRSRPVPGGLVHHMFTDDGRRLSATAVDVHGQMAQAALPEEARPRGLPLEPATAEDIAGLLGSGRAVIANIALVRAEHCDGARGMTDRHIVGCISNAAAAAWALAGFDLDLRRSLGLGTVAVELKLTPHERPSPGDVLEVVSAPLSAAARVLTMRHCVRNRSTGRVAATGEIVALLLDLTARRTVPLPRERLAPWLA